MRDSKEAIVQHFAASGYDSLIRDCMGEPAKTESGGDEWLYRCGAHEDHHPSLRINRKTGLYHCPVCGDGGDAFSLWQRVHSSSFSDACSEIAEAYGLACSGAAPRESHGLTVDELARAKGLSAEELRGWGMTDTTYSGLPAVRIPYLDENGTELTYSVRTAIDGKGRFRAPSGAKRQLYGLNWLPIAREQNRVIFVEGESDCCTGWAHGMPMVGVPGANVWREEWAGQFDDISYIFVVKEPDQGGAALVEALRRAFGSRLRVVELPAKDTSELYLQDRVRFVERFEKALEDAVARPPRDVALLGLADLYAVADVEWLLDRWIPKGALTLIAGETGVGKTWLASYFIACAIGAREWPDGTHSERHKVCLLETESLRGEYAKRLRGFGIADNSDALALPYPIELEGTEEGKWYVPSLPDDLEALVAPTIATAGPWIVVIDSLSGSHAIDENSSDMRALLGQLAAFAARHGVPVIAAHHLRKRSGKDTVGAFELDRVRGSSTTVQFARSVIGLEQLQPDGPVKVSVKKSTFAQKPVPFGFVIRDGGLFQVCDAPQRALSPTKQCYAATFLAEILGDGPRPSADILKLAEQEGLTQSTVRRAAREDVHVIQDGGMWSLPSRN